MHMANSSVDGMKRDWVWVGNGGSGSLIVNELAGIFDERATINFNSSPAIFHFCALILCCSSRRLFVLWPFVSAAFLIVCCRPTEYVGSADRTEVLPKDMRASRHSEHDKMTCDGVAGYKLCVCKVPLLNMNIIKFRIYGSGGGGKAKNIFSVTSCDMSVCIVVRCTSNDVQGISFICIDPVLGAQPFSILSNYFFLLFRCTIPASSWLVRQGGTQCCVALFAPKWLAFDDDALELVYMFYTRNQLFW